MPQEEDIDRIVRSVIIEYIQRGILMRGPCCGEPINSGFMRINDILKQHRDMCECMRTIYVPEDTKFGFEKEVVNNAGDGGLQAEP